MPVYEFRCRECDEYHDVILPLSKHKDSPPCPDCETAMSRSYTVPNLDSSSFPYAGQKYRESMKTTFGKDTAKIAGSSDFSRKQMVKGARKNGWEPVDG